MTNRCGEQCRRRELSSTSAHCQCPSCEQTQGDECTQNGFHEGQDHEKDLDKTVWQRSAGEFARRLCGKGSSSGAEDPTRTVDQYVNSQSKSEYAVGQPAI